MRLDMNQMRSVEGFQVSSLQNSKGDFCGVYTIPSFDANNHPFRKLVGYCDKSGQFVWVMKKYSKAP